MPAPTFVAEVEGASWDTITSPKTTGSVTPAIGDVLANFVGDEGVSTLGLTTNSGTAQTWTAKQTNTLGSTCNARLDTAVPTGGYTGADSNTSSALKFNNATYHFTGTNGVGATAKNAPPTTAGTVSITTTQPNSAVVVMCFDFSASDGTTRTWATVNGTTPTLGNGLEKTYFRNSINYTVYGAYYPDVGAAGAKTVGITAPSTSTAYTVMAVEILAGAATAAPAAQPMAVPGLTWLRRFRNRQQLPATPSTVTLPPTTDTATLGGFDWSGVFATSAASVVALATVGGLAWGGVRASSVADVTNTATVGSLSVGGVQATAGAGITSTATVGGLSYSGVQATSTNGITAPALVGGVAFGGLRAQSAADVTSPARVGGLAWSGVQAVTTTITPVNSPATVGGLAYDGIQATVVGVGTPPATVGGLAWSGVTAVAGAGSTNPAKVGGVAWAGVKATSVPNGTALATVGGFTWVAVPVRSVSDATNAASVAGVAWAGVQAVTAAIGVNDGTPVQNPRLTLAPTRTGVILASTGDLTLTSPQPGLELD